MLQPGFSSILSLVQVMLAWHAAVLHHVQPLCNSVFSIANFKFSGHSIVVRLQVLVVVGTYLHLIILLQKHVICVMTGVAHLRTVGTPYYKLDRFAQTFQLLVLSILLPLIYNLHSHSILKMFVFCIMLNWNLDRCLRGESVS